MFYTKVSIITVYCLTVTCCCLVVVTALSSRRRPPPSVRVCVCMRRPSHTATALTCAITTGSLSTVPSPLTVHIAPHIYIGAGFTSSIKSEILKIYLAFYIYLSVDTLGQSFNM